MFAMLGGTADVDHNRDTMAEPNEASDAPPPPPPGQIDLVGATLRRAYDEAATEALPPAFEELLRQLR